MNFERGSSDVKYEVKIKDSSGSNNDSGVDSDVGTGKNSSSGVKIT